MKPSRIADVLEHLLETRWSPFLWGPPGAGKSSIVRLVAERQTIPLIDIRALLLDPTDLRGIPTVENGIARWCPPSFLPQEGDEPGILFFDELNAAPPLVQASLYQLILDRHIGEYRLPDGWRIIAAGNRIQDSSITFRMPSALANRFIHLEFEIDFDDWRTWATQAGLHPLITGFLSLRRELLFDMRLPDRGFPTPRSWEMASDAFKAFGTADDFGDVLLGIVGEGAALEFIAYARQALTEEQVRDILAAPETAELPARLGEQYALVSYCSSVASDTELHRPISILLNRLPTELGVLLFRDLLRVSPRFGTMPQARTFVAKHAELLM